MCYWTRVSHHARCKWEQPDLFPVFDGFILTEEVTALWQPSPPNLFYFNSYSIMHSILKFFLSSQGFFSALWCRKGCIIHDHIFIVISYTTSDLHSTPSPYSLITADTLLNLWGIGWYAFSMTSFVVHDVQTMKLYGLAEIVFNLTWHVSLELHMIEQGVVLIPKRRSHHQWFAVAKQPEVIHF